MGFLRCIFAVGDGCALEFGCDVRKSVSLKIFV
jgi:hypothetical protein